LEHGLSKSTFGFLRSLNQAPALAQSYSGDSHVFPSKIVAKYFTSNRLTDRLIRDLVESHILQWKEILESFEFFEQTRKYIRRPRIAEVCCGHGLIGVLYAMLEEEVDEVLLTDVQIPPSQARVISAASALAPWIDRKLTVADKEITETHALVNPDTSIVSSHGCGALTDQAIDLGISTRGSVAVMPCCCHPRSPDAPEVLYRELGIKDGVDVYRTYKLHAAGRRVLWRYIPEAITPMNRILIGAVA